MGHWDKCWCAITPGHLWNLLTDKRAEESFYKEGGAASSDLAVLTEELAVFTKLLRSLKSGVISHASLISNV